MDLFTEDLHEAFSYEANESSTIDWKKYYVIWTIVLILWWIFLCSSLMTFAYKYNAIALLLFICFVITTIVAFAMIVIRRLL